MARYRFVDVHGFAGAMTLGIVSEGEFDLVGKKELQGAFGTANMVANRHLLPGPWEPQDAHYAEWETHDAELVAGNPPCSGFSLLSSKAFRGPDSRANACMWGITEYAAKVKPQIFMFESVTGAFTSGHALMLSLREKLERESGMQYGLTHILHTARACGNPQLRQRYLFVAHRVPFGVEPPHLEYLPMVQDAIDDLRDLPEQWEDQPIVRPAFSSYATALRRSDGLVDGHIGLNNTNSNRVKDVLAAVEWSEGELQNVVVKRMHDAGMELPPVWERRRDHFVRNGFNMGFHQPSRLRRNHTAPVCTGAAMDHFVHYAEDRLLTHREICRLMGYPDDWRVEPLRDSKGLRQTWGKGVTVQVGQWIGPWLKAALDGNPGSMTGELIGDRERLINVKAAWKTASKVA